ncbi:uncharacterized mitochondrial protein AtMg00300-like [Nicotiana sylvestris]|uniref:uncharacterized mitochondrial protein AtMg00300-like n=1 Tax=Nicotiana sylvestris TaxID=4096 RepID=UPI00388CAB77
MSGAVYMGDDNPLPVEGVGNIKLRMFDGIIRNIECWHVPRVKRNLISLSTLDDQGYKFHSENGILKVCKGSMVLMKGKLHSKLYHLQASIVEGEIVVASGKSDLNQSQLWNLRLGHMSDNELSLLSKQNLLNGYKNQALNFCEHCVFGKQTRIKFIKKAEHKTRDKLDYIHSDLWGPNRVPSKSGVRYSMTLIDDYSRMVWVYFLKTKDEAFSTVVK